MVWQIQSKYIKDQKFYIPDKIKFTKPILSLNSISVSIYLNIFKGYTTHQYIIISAAPLEIEVADEGYTTHQYIIISAAPLEIEVDDEEYTEEEEPEITTYSPPIGQL